MRTTERLPKLHISRIEWPARDGEVARIQVDDGLPRHLVFHIAVSRTAIVTLGNHGVEFDLIDNIEAYLRRPGVLVGILADSAAARSLDPDRYSERAFSSIDIGSPPEPGWMK